MIKNGIRRVQRSGKGSLMISLPKDWCQERGIVEGDAMKLVEVGKGLHMAKVE